jgi:acyl-CoA synthetase (NDP forming)
MTPGGKIGWRPLAPVAERSTILLDEAEAKALVARAGVPVPKGVSAPTLSSLIGLAEGLVPPLALKGLGFAHKSEAGAVRLGLTELHDQLNMEGATGYLAEEMVTGAVAELLIGLRRDPVYGVSLTVGLGGVTAELLADTVTLILPAAEDETRAALAGLKLWPLLDGYRGRAKADIAAVVAVVSRLATLMINNPDLEEIEINPLIVRQNGAVAVDALIRKAAP